MPIDQTDRKGFKMKYERLTNLSVMDIQQYQCNRFPLLFLDEVEEAIPGEKAVGHKNFTYNEWFFPAHFEDEPNVPGFIQVEALTQLFLMTFLTIPENKGKKTAFLSINNAKFKKKIIPGMRLDMIANLLSYKYGIAKGSVSGYLKNELACSVDLVVAIPDVLNKLKPKV